MMSSQSQNCGLIWRSMLPLWDTSLMNCPREGFLRENTFSTSWTLEWLNIFRISSLMLSSRDTQPLLRECKTKPLLSQKWWCRGWKACLMYQVSIQSTNLFFRQARQDRLLAQREGQAGSRQQEKKKDPANVSSYWGCSSPATLTFWWNEDADWQLPHQGPQQSEMAWQERRTCTKRIVKLVK